MENLELSGMWHLFHFMGFRVFFSILCGGIIGMERQLKNKSAGLKTNILICLGSTLYTSVSITLAESFSESGHYGDPARLAAQIVSGIGFLGGGAIIQARGMISGLTTAATIWVVAAIGVCIGMGHFGMGTFCALTVVLVLVGATLIEERFLDRSQTFHCRLRMDQELNEVKEKMSHLLLSHHLSLADFQAYSEGKSTHLSIDYVGKYENNKKFILELWKMTGIKEVKQG